MCWEAEELQKGLLLPRYSIYFRKMHSRLCVRGNDQTASFFFTSFPHCVSSSHKKILQYILLKTVRARCCMSVIKYLMQYIPSPPPKNFKCFKSWHLGTSSQPSNSAATGTEHHIRKEAFALSTRTTNPTACFTTRQPAPDRYRSQFLPKAL